jgi:hypothetical protein
MLEDNEAVLITLFLTPSKQRDAKRYSAAITRPQCAAVVDQYWRSVPPKHKDNVAVAYLMLKHTASLVLAVLPCVIKSNM